MSLRQSQNLTLSLLLIGFGFGAWAGDFRDVYGRVPSTERTCAQELESISLSPAQINAELKTLPDVMRAFSQGLVPNLEDRNQATAFALYLATAFGSTNEKSELPDVGFAQTQKVLGEFPEVLSQPRFRNMHIVFHSNNLDKMPPGLEELTDRLHRTARRTQANFNHVAANIGFYRKILQRPDLQADAWMTESGLEILNDPEARLIPKNLALAEYLLKQYRSQTHPMPLLAKTVADLIHNAAVLGGRFLKDLKGAQPETRLRAIKTILQRRDDLAMQMGFPDHYSGMLKDLRVTGPTGVSSPREIERLSAQIEGRSLWAKPQSDSVEIARTVRHLTVLEKPNRSCLGGSDCSSFTYFEYGFEPAVQYFTLTDERGNSSGQVTIVLGHLKKLDGSIVPAVFLDKVQNVSTSALLPMLEAIRLSLKEFGYPLYLGDDSADHSGLSNDSSTTEVYRSLLELMPPLEPAQFITLPSPFGFNSQYSRAYGGAKEFTPFSLPKGVDVVATPGRIDRPWRVKSLPTKATVQALLAMKDGKDIERGKYLTLMPMIEAAGIETSEMHDQLILQWMGDANLSAALKGDILINLLAREDDMDFGDYRAEDLYHLMREVDIGLPSLSSGDREALSNRLRAHGTEAEDPESWGPVDVWLVLLNWDHPERVTFLLENSAPWKFNDILTRSMRAGSEARTGSLEIFRRVYAAPAELMNGLIDFFALHPKRSWEEGLTEILGNGSTWGLDEKLDLLKIIDTHTNGIFTESDEIATLFRKLSKEEYQLLIKRLKERDPSAHWLPLTRPSPQTSLMNTL